jgi:glutathionyl-hydroquinone reductase
MEDLQKWKIQKFKIISDYTIELIFNDGKKQVINFEPVIGKGWMSKLKDTNYFQQVTLGPNKNLEWPDGQDFNPEALYNWEKLGPLYAQENQKSF